MRSNKTGDLITEGSLTHEAISVILASRCEWYTLLTELAKDLDLSGRRTHMFATFGIGDCIPLSPFHELQLQITKVDVQSLVAEETHKVRTNRVEDGYSYPRDTVAIIGASCRLPGANSIEELWDLISSGISRHTEVPMDRFDLHGSFRASQDRKFTDKRKFYGNFIDQVENFDHAFFRTNPKEALNMDPQQRVLLELAYQAMDSSGYLGSHRRESGDSVGCFIGASFAEYLDNTNAHPPTAYTSTGTIRAFLCGKISYYFGWTGPSEVLDTACSSSLVAINRACKAVQTGECSMALAGGVNIMTGINNFLDLAKAGFLSPTGQCKPFDQTADGYCRSEGGALVVLKLLDQALAEGDQILGVIPGIATNQGGLSSSITIPHSPAQKKLYQTVLRQAGMQSNQVSYVEAHGTGTQAGDPLEMASIREVFGGQDRTDELNVGSLKGNIGHAETAAGVASLLKVLAMINNARIPPQASHKSLNPKIPALGVDKMSVASKITLWRAELLAACVNSYGAGGSNCAMICCEGPPQKTEVSKQVAFAEAGSTYPIIISAASQESLYANAENLSRYLQKITPKPNLGDVAFTLSKRRKLHRHVFVTSASDINSLAQILKNEARNSFEVPQTPKRVVLAFGGQTKKTVNMERSLYESQPRLRNYIDECDKIVTNLGFSTLLPSIFQSEPLTDVVTLQCGTFAMQYACAKCWIDAGLQVAAMYMECAAMGVQLLQGHMEAGTLRFLDLSFQAALGVDLAREAFLTLEKSNDAQEWSFVIKSSSKADSKSRLSTHAKGKIMLTAQPDFRTYERLIAYRMSELESKPNTEKLMSNRAYGLFSQVVHYTDFLQGISHIKMDEAEAIADIDISEEARFGLEESTVTQYCDTIVIDTFIQVMGLLINSSNLVTSEDVYVATGVDHVSMSSACDFHDRKSWTVYTKYTSTGEGQAAGDVFVMTREGALAMIITGARFTKLLISKLEKFLDSANAKPSQGTAMGKQSLPQVPINSYETTSTAKSSEGTETPPRMDSSSATSVSSDRDLATSETVDDGAEKTLRNIIATYTGLSPAEIARDADICDLGVDSLAAVELAEELQAQFGKEITAEDLLISSYGALSELLVPFSSSKKATLPISNNSGPQVAVPTPPSFLSNVNASPQNTQGYQVVLKLLSDTSGAPIAAINGKATLEELGIDSLSAVELKGDLEDAFEIEIEDDRFTLDSTVKEILDFLGVGGASQKASSPAAATKSTNQPGRGECSVPVEKGQGKGVELASPMEALVQCEASFDQAAAKRGFSNYWTEVAQKQDELLLAYICEAFQALGSDIGQTPQGQQVPSIFHLPKHKKVMNRLLEILEKHDILTRQGLNLIRGSRQTPSMPAQKLHEQFLAKFPVYAGEARLMALTGPKLADCLTGKTDPITLMFRGAAAQKVMEDYYCASPMLSTLTEQLVTFISTVVTSSSTKSSDTPIRILEVGAGFGGTTTRLAEMLQASGIPVSYKFTDISPSLVKGAKAKFAKYPWMEFQALNLESDMPASLKDTYDIVIGTNCVHATTNKTKTISRLKSILNAQGFMVLSEVTQLVDWYDIVFGLLDGWWLANDGSNYPLQPPESWVRSFETAGFSRISYSQGPSPESNTQRLLVASNNQKMIAPPRDQEKQPGVQTVVYKEVDETQIEADIYLPAHASAKAMPVGTRLSPY